MSRKSPIVQLAPEIEMLWRDPALDGFILVEPDVIRCLQEYRQTDSVASEAGGILLGYRRGKHLHVIDATTPEDFDQRSRYAFNRTDRRHQERALTLWRRSGGTIDYLGEWHTHPQAEPQPSSIDLIEWNIVMRHRKVPMLFVIQGIEDVWLGVGVGNKKGLHSPARCALVDSE